MRGYSKGVSSLVSVKVCEQFNLHVRAFTKGGKAQLYQFTLSRRNFPRLYEVNFPKCVLPSLVLQVTQSVTSAKVETWWFQRSGPGKEPKSNPAAGCFLASTTWCRFFAFWWRLLKKTAANEMTEECLPRDEERRE